MNAESAAELSREELIALVGALRAHIAELERRLGLNSSNSSKPPSSDGLKKPARVSSLRERSGKKPGGQKGHKGETLRQVTDPDEVVNHYPSACSMCGVGLDPGTSVAHGARGRLLGVAGDPACAFAPTGQTGVPSTMTAISSMLPLARRLRGFPGR